MEKEKVKVIYFSLDSFYNAIVDAYKKIKKATNWKRFKNLWFRSAGMYEFFELYKDVMKKLNREANFSEFMKGWEHRVVLSENYKEAREEWINLCLSWY